VFLPIKYCVRCVMPETQEGQEFDEFGFCNVCRSSEEKMRVDWKLRHEQLVSLLEEAKHENRDNEYDCLIPISGGKDSTFQLHVLVKEFGMRPLAVTFSHNWFSAVGMYNLFNALETFDVDHIMFTPKRGLVNRIAKKSLEKIGDACWHCHAGVGAFPLRVAKDYGIRLIIWGESVAESSSRGTYGQPLIKFDQDYFQKVSAKVKPEAFVDEDIADNEIRKFNSLTSEDYQSVQITGIHLGDFIFWDEERQTEFVINEYGWMEDDVEGTYKGYKSTECIMPGVHDFACYLKRGYGRTSFHLSSDIRSGIISRADVNEEILEIEKTVPPSLDYFTQITGINLKEFVDKVGKHKHSSLVGVELPIIIDKDQKSRKLLFLEQLRNWLTVSE
jgi:N-acetyl sugar amidotransferase